jgi:hypothetical protein
LQKAHELNPLNGCEVLRNVLGGVEGKKVGSIVKEILEEDTGIQNLFIELEEKLLGSALHCVITPHSLEPLLPFCHKALFT